MKRKIIKMLDTLTDEYVPNKLEDVMNSTAKMPQSSPVTEKRAATPAHMVWRKILAPAVCCCLIAVLSIGVWRSGMLTTPTITLDNNSTISDNHGEGDQSNPTANSQGNNPSNPAVTDPPAPSQTTPNNPSNPGSDTPSGNPSGDTPSGGTPGGDGANAVLQEKVVNYQEAKDIFGHSIVECFESNFVNYTVGIVSPNGDGNGYCESVNYNFTNGQITLIDQDRMNSFVFSDSGLYDKIEYSGQTFFVTKENYLSDSRSEIWYCPKMESVFGVGIVYSAHFDKSVDQAKIIDLILNLEIK